MYLFLKDLCLTLFSPLPVCVWILSAGAVLVWCFPGKRVGGALVTFGILLLLLFGLPLVPDLMLERLEYAYASHVPKSDVVGKPLRYIVVLAGGYRDDPGIPVASRFSHHGLLRLVTGVQLYRQYEGAKLVLSGGAGGGSVPEAELMAQLSMDLGVPIQDIILESKSASTHEEAMFVRPIVGDNEFLLVTSASHMPRAMGLFRGLDMKPLPAPTGYLVKRGESKWSVVPSSYNLEKSYAVLYEYFGQAKERLLGRM